MHTAIEVSQQMKSSRCFFRDLDSEKTLMVSESIAYTRLQNCGQPNNTCVLSPHHLGHSLWRSVPAPRAVEQLQGTWAPQPGHAAAASRRVMLRFTFDAFSLYLELYSLVCHHLLQLFTESAVPLSDLLEPAPVNALELVKLR